MELTPRSTNINHLARNQTQINTNTNVLNKSTYKYPARALATLGNSGLMKRASPSPSPSPSPAPYRSKNGKNHDAVEHWLGQHNRKFEMLRTVTSLISAGASSIVLLKVFGIV
jgi:hypothetical protein